jgi:hypothetical protein
MIDFQSPWVDVGMVVLCSVGLVAALLLTARRYTFFGTHTLFHRRLLLVDLMLALTMIELVFDAIAESVWVVDGLRSVMHLLAIAGRGAVVTGVVALLLTFPGDVEEKR